MYIDIYKLIEKFVKKYSNITYYFWHIQNFKSIKQIKKETNCSDQDLRLLTYFRNYIFRHLDSNIKDTEINLIPSNSRDRKINYHSLRPKDKIILWALEYKKINNFLYSPDYFKTLTTNLQNEYSSIGYIKNNEFWIPKNAIFYNDYYFAKLEYLLFWYSKYDINGYLIIDDSLLTFLNNLNIKTSKRALIALLERKDSFLKLESHIFRTANWNDPIIANELFVFLYWSNDKHNKVLNKNQLFNVLSDIIRKYKLVYDEPYYLLKKYYFSFFSFSTGNSMDIYLEKVNDENKKTLVEKLESKYGFLPQAIKENEFFSMFGGSTFVIQNNSFLWKGKDKTIVYLNIVECYKNLKPLLLDFFANIVNHKISYPKYLEYLSNSENHYLKILSYTKSYILITLKIMGDFLYKSNGYLHKNKN